MKTGVVLPQAKELGETRREAGTDPSQAPPLPGAALPCRPLISDFRPPDLWAHALPLFEATQFLVLCHGSSRKLIQSPRKSCLCEWDVKCTGKVLSPPWGKCDMCLFYCDLDSKPTESGMFWKPLQSSSLTSLPVQLWRNCSNHGAPPLPSQRSLPSCGPPALTIVSLSPLTCEVGILINAMVIMRLNDIIREKLGNGAWYKVSAQEMLVVMVSCL